MAELIVTIIASVPGRGDLDQTINETIPPAYDQQDIDALAVRRIEDAAFTLTRREFDRAPTLQALIAAAARLKAIEAVLDGPDGIVPREVRIRTILALSNAEATETYGEAPEG